MPKVIIWRDGAIETEFDPAHRDWRIGRSETNDITLLDPRKSVSRFHAELREEHGQWIFIDLNSQNGSWRDGQRVNRLNLEHGHEVLFGDYKLSFEDVKAPPPPPPVTADPQTRAAGVETSPNQVPADQTLLMPGARAGVDAASVPGPPAPVMRAATKPKAPRKGVNPLILVVFVLVMLGAAAAVAYRLLTSGRTASPAAESSEVAQETGRAGSPSQTGAGTPDETTTADAPSGRAGSPRPPSPEAPQPGASGSADGRLGQASLPVPPPGPPPTAPGRTPPGTAGDGRPGQVSPSGPPPSTPRTTPPRSRRQPPAPPREPPALVARYDEGRRALQARRFAEAERAFAAVMSQDAGFRDTAALLAQSRQGQVEAREGALADAQSLEASGDWAKAVAAYERAGAPDQAAAARTKMRAAGDDAYRKARQFDARNRPTDAIAWYQRAVDWLPAEDPRRQTAVERLATLKGGGE